MIIFYSFSIKNILKFREDHSIGAVALIAYEVSEEHVEGDQTLFIGRVTDIHREEAEPLIFYSGRYRALAEEKAVTV